MSGKVESPKWLPSWQEFGSGSGALSGAVRRKGRGLDSRRLGLKPMWLEAQQDCQIADFSLFIARYGSHSPGAHATVS